MGWPFYPEKVRVWHFLVLPTLGMAAAILTARLAEFLLQPVPETLGYDLFHVGRTVLISLIMAAQVTWLAIAYRRQFEERLRTRNRELETTREFLTRIIEGSAEAIVTVDARQRIASWNLAAERIYGWKADEMIGHGLERLLPDGEAAREEIHRLDGQVRQGRTLRDYQTTHVRKDGARITVRMTWSPFRDATGKYEGSTTIIRDVTSLLEMERRLREQDRLAAVGRLAAQVAHEIKNPLAGIRGACEVMMVRLTEQKGQEIAEEVVRQIDRLNRTVEDLLLFARPMTARPQPTDVHELIDRVLAVVLEQPNARTLTVEREYAAQMPPLNVDPEQMQQVLFNVLLNATQAMGREGTMTVGTRLDESTATVSVRDSGPGIAEDTLENIFEPFYTTRAQGTGLGLAIVKKIVQSHRGTIEATTPSRGGAEFQIHLPL
jgi:two-component system sensor histidine kinase HydH